MAHAGRIRRRLGRGTDSAWTNVVNLSLMLGDRYFGTRGALTALAGMLCFPLLVALGIAALFAASQTCLRCKARFGAWVP